MTHVHLAGMTSQRTPRKHNLEDKMFIGLGWQGLGGGKELNTLHKAKKCFEVGRCLWTREI